MDRIDNGIGSFVMGMFRYSSFVGSTNQIAKPAPTNGTSLGKPCSSMLRPENFLSGSCMRRRSPTNRTETMAVPNEDSPEARPHYRPIDLKTIRLSLAQPFAALAPCVLSKEARGPRIDTAQACTASAVMCGGA